MKEVANGIMPFVNDEKAIGKWDFFDIVSSQNKFNPIIVMNFSFNKWFYIIVSQLVALQN